MSAPGGATAWDVLALLGALHGLFLALTLWSQPRGPRRANRLLALLLLLYSIQLLHIALYWTHGIERIPWFWGTVWPLPYLYGPLLCFHVQALSGAEPPRRWVQLLHAAPFALCALLFARFYALPDAVKRRLLAETWSQQTGSTEPFVLIVFGLQLVHFIAYLAPSLGRLRSGAVSQPEARWVSRLCAGFGLSFVCWFAYGFAVGLGWPYSKAIDTLATLVMSLSIYAFGYTALRDPEVFLGELLRRARGRYLGSPLSDAELAAHKRRLGELMRTRRPHLDAELRLDQLAALAELTPHQLSQVINRGFEERFNDFVNRHRVEDARRLLEDPARRAEPLLSLAFEAGFNNKTSFNQAFKKFTRTTPSRYRANGSGGVPAV